MAIQKKVSDPTEAALSAIEEALTGAPAGKKPDPSKDAAPRLPSVDTGASA